MGYEKLTLAAKSSGYPSLFPPSQISAYQQNDLSMSSSQIQKELDAAIAHAKAHPDDTETQEQAMDLLVQKLADPEVLAQLIQEIKTLSQYSLDIQAAMGDVDDIFRKIQLSNVSNDIKNDVETLKHKWSGHMKISQVTSLSF
ncbi:hypothetical protein K474DRAFT_409540 [Panus rudis PR-1116 ss-1]|nr:hypothetical protein K474DRAFT_409540 [Panus rudis PR-1116 ss-1]